MCVVCCCGCAGVCVCGVWVCVVVSDGCVSVGFIVCVWMCVCRCACVVMWVSVMWAVVAPCGVS